MAMLINVDLHDEQVSAGTWGPVFFEIWRGQGRPATFRSLREAALRAARAQPGGKVLLFTTVRSFPVPSLDGELRHEVNLRRQMLVPYTLGSVTVLESKGFAGSIVRSIIAGLIAANRPAHPAHIFATVDEASPWAARLLASAGVASTAAEVRAAHDRIAAGLSGLAA
jgi:hypothetical protein